MDRETFQGLSESSHGQIEFVNSSQRMADGLAAHDKADQPKPPAPDDFLKNLNKKLGFVSAPKLLVAAKREALP